MTEHDTAPARDPVAPEPATEPATERRAKPASIWIAQALLAVSTISIAINVYQWLPYGIAAAAPSIALLCLLPTLIILAQLRRPTARWAFGLGAGSLWIYMTARTWLRVFAELPPGEPPKEHFGDVFASILLTVLVLLVTARVLFGDAAKQYFASGRSVARTEHL